MNACLLTSKHCLAVLYLIRNLKVNEYIHTSSRTMSSRWYSRKGAELWPRTLFISVKVRLLIWIDTTIHGWHSELSVNMGYMAS